MKLITCNQIIRIATAWDTEFMSDTEVVWLRTVRKLRLSNCYYPKHIRSCQISPTDHKCLHSKDWHKFLVEITACKRTVPFYCVSDVTGALIVEPDNMEDLLNLYSGKKTADDIIKEYLGILYKQKVYSAEVVD